jgi:chorismate lyase/3-hydroxybenzoate synthase
MIVSPRKIRPADAQAHGIPLWLSQRLSLATAPAEEKSCGECFARVTNTGGFSLVSVRVAQACEFNPNNFAHHVCNGYQHIAKLLKQSGSPHPVRFWNVIPDIHRPVGEGTDRYMSFNAGRFRALAEWFGGADSFAGLVPAASGVGHDGDDLIIHALGARTAGTAISNPRQIAPYRYSRRFGPLPPCFARATLIHDRDNTPLLLVGGTASIRGEDSVHPKDLRQQTRETLENLACLVATASGAKYSSDQQRAYLRPYQHLRVYHPRLSDRQGIGQMLSDAFGNHPQIEFVRAELCRSELLVEIEGAAQLDGTSGARLAAV